jgi:hypothetical protein
MLKCLIALTSLLSAAAVAVPAWTWVDEQGRRHYSDTPVEGATRIELAGSQTFTSNAPAADTGASNQEPAEENPEFNYTVVEVISPAPEQTVTNTSGSVTVEVAIYPPLRSTDRIDAVLDGERIRIGSRSLTMTLNDVIRGEHSLQAMVVGADGQEIRSSIPVTFFVRQNSALIPSPAGAAPRPSITPTRPPPPPPPPKNGN